MAVPLGRFTVCGIEEPESGEYPIRLLPHVHGNAFPFWSESTSNILDALTVEDVKGKRVLDFGAGASGILGIAAWKLGAKHIDFVERDRELAPILTAQAAANKLTSRIMFSTTEHYDFALVNLGNAVEVGKVSQLAEHGIGTDEQGEVLRW